MRVLVTGASGLLGSHLLVGSGGADEVVGIDRNPWWAGRSRDVRIGELTEEDFVDAVLEEVTPDLLFHCAALTSVDACERDADRALRVNGELTGRLARRAADLGALFVYISTDAVFRGDRPDKSEDDFPDPPTAYGRSKLLGEELTADAGGRWLIVRTNLYGWSSGRKTTSAEWMYGALESGEPVILFDDFWFNPIYCVDLVGYLWTLVEGGHTGLFHVAGRDRVTKYDFGMALAAAAGLSTDNVSRGSVRDAGLAAERPPDLSLSSDKYRRVTGRDLPAMEAGVRRFVEDRGRGLDDRLRR